MFITRKFNLLIIASLLLSGCFGSEHRYMLEDASPAHARPTAAKLVLVEKMDLPEYFTGGEITFQDRQGVLISPKDSFWADSPDRAFSEMLADALDKRLTADVAAAPWPFEVPADVKVEVKVRHFVALNNGMLDFKGQYFLSSPYGGTLAKSGRFNIQEPLTQKGLSGLTKAYSRALSKLSDIIARRIAGVSRAEL